MKPDPKAPVSIQHPWIYWDADSNTYVYRASSLGSCIRSLTAARLGEDAFPFNAAIQASMDASSGLEDEIIRRFKIEMASDEVIWAQREVELEIPGAEDADGKADGRIAIVRGHLDGLYQLDDSVLEIKALGTTNFEKYMTGLSKRNNVLDGLDALGSLGDKYRLQLGCYGHATERKVRLVVGHKVKDLKRMGPDGDEVAIWAIEEVDISPPMDPSDLYPLSDLHARIQFIEECAAKDELPECTAGCREGDPYSESHLFTGPTVATSDLDQLIRDYADLKSKEDDIKELKDVIRERIITEYGVGKYTAGPFSARVEHVKPTQRVDSKKLKKSYPDIWEECSTWGAPTIRLTVTGGKRDATD